MPVCWLIEIAMGAKSKAVALLEMIFVKIAISKKTAATSMWFPKG